MGLDYSKREEFTCTTESFNVVSLLICNRLIQFPSGPASSRLGSIFAREYRIVVHSINLDKRDLILSKRMESFGLSSETELPTVTIITH